MPSRGQSLTVSYVAWNTTSNGGQTGDAGSHELRWVKDGTSAAPTNSPTEVDSTYAPGIYKLTLTSTECTCDFGTLCGKSLTSGVVLMPISVSFEQLPTAAPAASGGLITIGTSTGQLEPDGAGRVNVGKWLDEPVTLDTNHLPNVNVADYNNAAVTAQPYTGTPPTAAAIATAVWQTDVSTGFTGSQAGAKLEAAGTASDPWATTLPGSYGAGTAGYLLGTNLNTTISSRLASSTYTVPPTAATITAAVWTADLSSGYSGSQAGALLDAVGTSADPWNVTLPGSYGAGTAGYIVGHNIDTNVSSRLASSAYASPPTAAANAAAVWLVDVSSGYSGGQAGARLNVAGLLGDPMATTLPGAYSAGTAGYLLGTYLNAPVSGCLTTAGYTAPPTAAAIATAVWTVDVSTGFTGSQAGNKLNAAGTASDPWATTLPGSYSAGTAGYIMGHNLDTNVGSRLATSGYTTPPTAGTIATAVLTDTTDTGTVGSLGYLLGHAPSWYASPSTIATAVWTVDVSTGFSGSQAGAKLEALSAGDPWATTLPGSYSAGTAGYIMGHNLDTNVGSRLATSGYTVPPTAGTIATAVWTVDVSSGFTGSQAGAKLEAAGTASDPWATALPGSYSAGTAGYIMGHNLDTNVGSRLATSGYTAPPTASTIATAVWTVDVSSGFTGTQAGECLLHAAAATDPWSIALPGVYGAGTAGYLIGHNLDTNVGSRLAASGYTAPPTASTIATAVWTVNISSGFTGSQAGAKLEALSAGDPWNTALPGSYATGTAGYLLSQNLDAKISTRSTFAGGAVASVTAGVVLAAAGLDGITIETTGSGALNGRQAIAQVLSATTGPLAGTPPRGTAGTMITKDPTDTDQRLQVDVDGYGNRTAVRHYPPA